MHHSLFLLFSQSFHFSLPLHFPRTLINPVNDRPGGQLLHPLGLFGMKLLQPLAEQVDNEQL
ncbi:hypothetical protein D3C81_2134440 [compost metagenome]